jgi:hypothetical protein
MSAPNVTVAIEPNDAGSILVCELAPPASSEFGAAQVSLRVEVTNHEASAVHLSSVSVQFPGSSVPAATIPTNLLVDPGASDEWHFEAANNFIIPWPGPLSISVDLKFDGYSTQVTVAAPLKAHVSPVADGAYVFPFLSGSLGAGEYFGGQSGVHGAAGGGVQLFAYDLGIVAIDEDSGQWSTRFPGTDGSKNEHYRIWGKPVYAMADGEIQSWEDEYPANPHPPADLSPPIRVEGNHFYIQHGDELMLYAHLQLGTLPSHLKHEHASVTAGEYLGLVGNSGNSSEPHIHLHAIKGTLPWQGPPRPMPFRLAGTIARASMSGAPMTPPWVDLAGRGLPAEPALVWPGVLPYNWKGIVGRYTAVDPLALVLSNEVYVRLTLPDPPPLEVLRSQISDVLRTMTRAERSRTLTRVQSWGRWANSLAGEVESIAKALNEQ